jgi:hypothetical protein
VRFRYLRPGLAVILAAVAVKLLLDGVYEPPAWATPAFIAAVLADPAQRRRAHRKAESCLAADDRR